MKQRLALAALILWILCPGVVSGRVAKESTAPVSLRPLTFAQWQHKLAGYRGQVVIVDFWATWCAPCLERFPHMVSLYQKYGSRGNVRFVSISLDDREDPQALQRASDFLKRQKAEFENYRMDEIVPDAFEKLNLLGIPAVFIYDRAGQLRYRLTGDDPNRQFTNEDVDAAIKSLSAGTPANSRPRK